MNVMDIVDTIIKIAVSVYKQLGCGYTEFVYQRAMEIELRTHKINYENEKRVSVYYKDANGTLNTISENRLDLYVYAENGEQVMVELKSMSRTIHPNDIEQLKRYRKMLEFDNLYPSRGVLINFPQSANKTVEISKVLFEQ